MLTHQADVILTPTLPMTALQRPSRSDVLGFTDTSLFVQMMRFIWPGNLAGLPGLAGTDHVGFTVPDIEAATDFFVNVKITLLLKLVRHDLTSS